jgi:alpha-ribazole phosphatase
MILILVRHTKVDVPSGLCYGQTDVNLASSFEQEKNSVLDSLANEDFECIYSSPSQRCAKLANAISHKKPIIIEPRLLELNFGSWEGQKWDDISCTNEGQKWFADYINIPCPSGESYLDLMARVKVFLSEIKIKYARQKIVLVTHSGVIRAINSFAKGIDPKAAMDLKVDFGGICKLEL